MRDSEYNGSQQEWEGLLEFALSATPQADLSHATREGLDVQCRQSGQDSRSKLIINIQISVEDIKSKRCSLQLEYAKNTDDVSFYDWTSQLIDERNALQSQVRKQQAESSENKAKILGVTTLPPLRKISSSRFVKICFKQTLHLPKEILQL